MAWTPEQAQAFLAANELTTLAPLWRTPLAKGDENKAARFGGGVSFDGGKPAVAEPFLAANGMSLHQLIGKNRSWTELRRRAGLEQRPQGPVEAALLKRVRSVVHVDDRNRVVALGSDLAEPVPGDPDQKRGDCAEAA